MTTVEHRSGQEFGIEKGRLFLDRLDSAQVKSSEMWAEIEPILIKFFPDQKSRDLFRNPSHDYSINMMVRRHDFSQVELNQFVNAVTAIYRKYGQLGAICDLWSERDAILEADFDVHRPVQKLRPYADLYAEALESGLFEDALHIAESDMYRQNIQYYKTHAIKPQADLTLALEAHASDVIAASQLSLAGDPTAMKWKSVIQLNYLQTIFNTYHFEADAYNPENMYKLRHDGYASEHPSRTAIDVAKQCCRYYLSTDQPWFALEYAEEAHLEVHDPILYREIQTSATSIKTTLRRLEAEVTRVVKRRTRGHRS